jgi:hypothetical protein
MKKYNPDLIRRPGLYCMNKNISGVATHDLPA